MRSKSTNDDFGFYHEPDFLRLLRLEQKRASRSQRPILLMLIDIGELLSGPQSLRIPGRIASSLSGCIRETDVMGWYENYGVIGVIFTEVASPDQTTREGILQKVQRALHAAVGAEGLAKTTVSFHVFPEGP